MAGRPDAAGRRVAFVTGAGSGIGRAGAIAMAAEGALVIVTDRDGDRSAAVAEEIAQPAAGPRPARST
jgi:NAD(P)-dependent dehydrogenase (short-subunit alcohol dehydrogenase family)